MSTWQPRFRSWAVSRWFLALYGVLTVMLILGFALNYNGGIALIMGVVVAVSFGRYLLWRRRELWKPSR